MVETMAGAAGRYALDGSDEDLGRLLMVANVSQAMARSAFRRVGVHNGWRAIDCGCGPARAEVAIEWLDTTPGQTPVRTGRRDRSR